MSCSPPLSCFPLPIDKVVELIRVAAADDPALVVLVLDGSGLLVTTKALDLTLAEVEDECRRLAGILAPVDGLVVLVSVNASFGTDPEPVFPSWWEVRRRVAAAGGTLLDWLLVDGRGTTSVARAVEASGR